MGEELDNSRELLKSAPAGSIKYQIPGTVKYIYGVDSTHYAFYSSKSTIEEVTFENPSNLIEIQKCAFYECTKLRTINLQQCTNLIYIGNYAFYTSTNLQTINFPESQLKTVDESAFQYSGLTELVIPLSITKIGIYCFAYCESLQSITLPDDSPLAEIPQGCFIYCTKLTRFRLPKNTIFTGNAIGYCTSMQSYEVQDNHIKYKVNEGILYTSDMKTLVCFPAGLYKDDQYSTISGLTTIYDFSFCGSLINEIILNEEITSIGSYSFSASKISKITFSNNLETIYSYCFVNCKNLVEIVLPERLKSLGASAFQECTNLKSITFPSSITNIGGGVFSGINISNLEIKFGDESNLKLNDQNMITDNDETFISMYIGDLHTVNIKNTVTNIKSKAFFNNKKLTTVSFEETPTLMVIEDSAFDGCENLKNIVLPNSLIKIYNYAFQNCKKIESIHLSSNFLEAWSYSFAYCYGLKEIQIENHEETNYNLSLNAFTNCISLEKIELGEGLTEISNSLFKLSNITTINLPSSITAVREYGFSSCYNLESIDFTSTKVTSIGNFAFENCYKLKVIECPDLIDLGQYALSSTSIEEVTFPPKLTSIGTCCFYNCTQLTSITIPENSQLTSFDSDIFTKCKNFTKIYNSCPSFSILNEALYDANKTNFIILPPNSPVKYLAFPDTLKTIRAKALLDCQNIEIIMIPSYSVQEIMENAFEGCSNLVSINIPESVQTIRENAFLRCNKLRCGLVIENTSQTFTDMLINTGIPQRSLKECINKCTFNLQTQCSPRSLFIYSVILIF